MRSPNFLILDEPTNDLDIITLQILEDYLKKFKGCLIVVSHDRYFMDKVVDHLLVFQGDGDIRDFPGNYTQYRLEAKSVNASLENARKTGYSLEVKGTKIKTEQKRRLSFKEKKELEELETLLPALEAEKAALEALLSGGATLPDDIARASKRYQEVQEELDMAELRWLELSEFAE
jgi:ATP-binding cassette subfamily F protein uup